MAARQGPRRSARARAHTGRPCVGAGPTRDLAIVVCLGEIGLRSEELRRLRLTDLTGIRAGSATPWLQVGRRPQGLGSMGGGAVEIRLVL